MISYWIDLVEHGESMAAVQMHDYPCLCHSPVENDHLR
jgi:hypothetical protein